MLSPAAKRILSEVVDSGERRYNAIVRSPVEQLKELGLVEVVYARDGTLSFLVRATEKGVLWVLG